MVIFYLVVPPRFAPHRLVEGRFDRCGYCAPVRTKGAAGSATAVGAVNLNVGVVPVGCARAVAHVVVAGEVGVGSGRGAVAVRVNYVVGVRAVADFLVASAPFGG